MTADAKDLKEKASAARDAVADLDEPLKTEAFKIFLAQLLSEGNTGNKQVLPSHIPRPKATGRPKSASAKKKERKTAPTESTLRLDVGGLKKLGTYCARFALQGTGTEQMAFILANFVREHTDMDFVTAGDIAYLHRQLISQRVKVAPVNNSGDWTRALRWLTAPSRRKEWLEKRGGGYVVSNSGLLHWHQLEEEANARAQIDRFIGK